VSRPLSRCEAAVEVLRLLSRYQRRRRSVEAAVKAADGVFEAAVEVSRPPSRWSRLLSRC
jgi:hypothetical protein